MNPFILLALNSLILLTGVSLNSILGKSVKQYNKTTQVIYGLIFSLLLYIIMSFSYVTTEGIFYDSRALLLGFISLYYHPISVLIATASAMFIRVGIGGAGTFGGILEIGITVIFGFLWRFYISKLFKGKSIYIQMWLFSFTVQASTAAFQFILPLTEEQLRRVMFDAMLPMMLIYPIIMVLLAMVYFSSEKAVKNAETIKEQEEHLRLIFDGVPVGIVEFDKDIKMISCNKLFASMLGRTQSQLIGMSFHDIPNKDLLHKIEEALDGETSYYTGPYEAFYNDKSLFLDIQFSPMRNAEGDIIAGVGIVTDLSQKRRQELEHIDFLVASLFEKSPREKEHSERVSYLAAKVGEELGFDKDEIQNLKTTGILHDIGKLNIDEAVLEKNGPLNANEYLSIKNHVQVGYRILSKVKEYNEIANTVLHHHERWDGTGYPEGLKGNEIPLISRIIAVCDTFDAMTNKRPYREPLSRIYARTEIVKHSGSQFDPEIADAFVRLLDKGVID